MTVATSKRKDLLDKANFNTMNLRKGLIRYIGISLRQNSSASQTHDCNIHSGMFKILILLLKFWRYYFNSLYTKLLRLCEIDNINAVVP